MSRLPIKDNKLKLKIFNYNKKVDEEQKKKASLADNKIKENYYKIIKYNKNHYIKIYQVRNDKNVNIEKMTDAEAKELIKRQLITTDNYSTQIGKNRIYSEKKIGFTPNQIKQIFEEIKTKFDYTTIAETHVILGQIHYSKNKKLYDELNIKNIKLYNTDGPIYTKRNLYEYINYNKLPKILQTLAEKYFDKNTYFNSFKNFFNQDKTYQDLEDIYNNEQVEDINEQKNIFYAYNDIIINLIDIKNNLIDKKYELYQELTNDFYLDFALSMNGLNYVKQKNFDIEHYKLATQYGRFYDLKNYKEINPFELDTTKKSAKYVNNNWASNQMQKVIASMFRFYNYFNDKYVAINETKIQIDHILGKLNQNLLKSKNNSINNLRPISHFINLQNLNTKQVEFKNIDIKDIDNKDILDIFKPKDLEYIIKLPEKIDYKQLYENELKKNKELMEENNKLKEEIKKHSPIYKHFAKMTLAKKEIPLPSLEYYR